MTAFVIPAADWSDWAPLHADRLARMAAGSGGRFKMTDIDAALRSGTMQAWTVPAGYVLMVTEIVVYPQLRALRLIGCVGTHAHLWGRLMPFVKDTARLWGCSRLEALHPPSWPLERRGWTTFHILSEMPL